MTEPTALLAGKRGLVMGVANDRSIAWGIAKLATAHGAKIGLTYQGELFEKRVKPLADELKADLLLDVDVTDDASMDAAFAKVEQHWGGLDFVVHAIGYSDKEELQGLYMDTTPANFTQTMMISCYSFTAVARRASKLMTNCGSLVTLTDYGAERVMPNYNVMGVAKAALEASVRYLAVDLGPRNIRVNALSAGPIKTLAAHGISDFRYILKWNQYNSPLKRNVTQEDIAGAGLYLLSDLSSGVTGETHHVDSGYHVVGMKAVDAPDIAVAP
jgi:enoyl-[acyl-carrier protein] reductase I